MVKPVNVPAELTSAEVTPSVVEIVGPAGAGKTTLFHMVTGQRKNILAGSFPPTRNAAGWPFFLRHLLLVTPVLLRVCVDENRGRLLTRRELAWLAILNGWHYLLRREAAVTSSAVLLDQGPIFLLAQLYVLGPKGLRNPILSSWWQETFRNWAATLDLVVYLDALDLDLMERINSRDELHEMKGKSRAEVSAFLNRYRVAYQEVISHLQAFRKDLPVLHFDTARICTDGIADNLLAELKLRNCDA